MQYRADIDGLRALAVLLVVMFHAEFAVFQSGFIGVDVFFVISGFLMTRIIFDKMEQGRFSFLAFYMRRLWRLQPACIALMLVLYGVVFYLYLPEDLLYYERSVRKASLFIVNQFFANTTTDYFHVRTDTLPLLHLWSLAIEWQCYLLLPWVLWACFKASQWPLMGEPLTPRQRLLIILSVLCLLAIVCSKVLTHYALNKAYFSFGARFFEFLMGGVAALWCPKPITRREGLIGALCNVALLCLIGVATLGIQSGYPNGYALLISVSTALLLSLLPVAPHALSYRLLSAKAMVFIGQLSYSWYLWHWGLFTIAHYLGLPFVGIERLLLIALSFGCGYLSWRWIEQPFKGGIGFAGVGVRGQVLFSFLALVISPIVISHGMSLVIKNHDGFPERFDRVLVDIYQKLNRYPDANRKRCIGGADVNTCVVGQTRAPVKRALMIGDSFANHYWWFMDTLGRDAKVKITMLSTSSCLTLPGILLYDWGKYSHQVYEACAKETEGYYQQIAREHYDWVILAQAWPNYVGAKIISHQGEQTSLTKTQMYYEAALDKALQQIVQSGARPVIVMATAPMPEALQDCFYHPIKMRQKQRSHGCHFKRSYGEADRFIEALIFKMKKRYKQLVIIDPVSLQCPNGQCSASIDGVPYYRDIGHITDYASHALAVQYLARNPNPFGDGALTALG